MQSVNRALVKLTPEVASDDPQQPVSQSPNQEKTLATLLDPQAVTIKLHEKRKSQYFFSPLFDNTQQFDSNRDQAAAQEVHDPLVELLRESLLVADAPSKKAKRKDAEQLPASSGRSLIELRQVPTQSKEDLDERGKQVLQKFRREREVKAYQDAEERRRVFAMMLRGRKRHDVVEQRIQELMEAQEKKQAEILQTQHYSPQFRIRNRQQ